MALALLLVALALALAPRKMLLFGRLSGTALSVFFLMFPYFPSNPLKGLIITKFFAI